MILGLDESDTYGSCLDAVATRDYPPCEICLLRAPDSEEEEDDLHWNFINFSFLRATLTGLFVPKFVPSPHRITYVDIVQRHVSSNVAEVKTEDSLPLPPRKVSNASTVTTQADEEISAIAPDLERATSYGARKTSHHDDLTTMNSDFLELACSTQRRKMRIESRKKEFEAKKHDIGLLAVIPCPRDEPDRSTSPAFRELMYRIVELHSQSPRETMQQVLSLSMSLF